MAIADANNAYILYQPSRSDGGFDFCGKHVLATRDDFVALPTHDVQIALSVKKAEIIRLEGGGRGE
jgi:hypothetical protein